MDINLFFEKLVKKLNLGTIIENPSRISGGLTHKMYSVVTSDGKYIVKLLNPNIMKRRTAIENFNRADNLEKVLIENNIEAIYSIEFNNKKMQEIDGQYFYVYKWYDGKTLKDNNIKEIHCKKIGEVVAKIHNIDLKNEKYECEEINIVWNRYIDLAKKQQSTIYDILNDNLDMLNNIMQKGNEVIKNIPDVVAICHNDLDSKNVLWLNDEYKIIDLECLGYSNPYLELLEIALCWSGYETCNINFNLFKTLIQSYLKNTKLDRDIDWECIYYSNFGRLNWLEYNIKRALMIECDNYEEQKLGIDEVIKTIKHISYYYSIKEEILNNI